ncbi:MAG: heme exporter protein CcmD [Pseudomonadota bacterium]
MNWGSFSEFAAMGGYGVYVWGSYAVAALLMALEPLLAARRHRDALRRRPDDMTGDDDETAT